MANFISRLKRRFVGLVCGLIVLAASVAAADAPIKVPPEPDYPERQGMSDEEFGRVWDQWRAAHRQWESNLTAEQVIMLKRRDAEKRAKSQERFQREHQLPVAADGYDWRQQARATNLDADVIADLERDHMAFGNSRRQSFDAYLSGPVFITSDSLLNAFHVLFEDSFRELELRRATELRVNLERLLGAVRALSGEPVMAPQRFTVARAHVEQVLGPALVLLGAPLEDFPSDLQGGIATEVEQINQAGAQQLPAWLTPVDGGSVRALDYRSCRPVGFYTESNVLQTYFRAMRWLQIVPFRAAVEHEFDAMVLLALAGEDSGAGRWLSAGARLIGPSDDPTMVDLQYIIDRTFPRRIEDFDQRNPSLRDSISRSIIADGYYQINSDVRRRTTVTEAFSQLTFRVVSAGALPDATVFQRMMDLDRVPSGLEVSAFLGSRYAAERLGARERKIVDGLRPAWVDDALERSRWHDAMIYIHYLRVLEALFLPVAEEAPQFAHGEAWAAKNCQTALAGWAQMRHTFTLQAKIAKHYLGLVELPPGFVEPNPEFFARMARLVDKTEATLAASQCFEPSTWQEAEELRELAQAVVAPPIELLDLEVGDPATLTNLETLEFALRRAREYASDTDPLLPSPFDSDAPDLEELKRRLVAVLQRKADAIERGESPPRASTSGVRERWIELSHTAHALEALAHKQLRGMPWTPEEEAFLKGYGEAMAGVMGYEGNSWLTPRDDAPRCAEVAGFPQRGVSLSAAIGRPRDIYVLYPWQGIDVLCTGSVMQYYEFETDKPLTDEEWLAKLDSDSPPPIPNWLADYADAPGKPPPGHE